MAVLNTRPARHALVLALLMVTLTIPAMAQLVLESGTVTSGGGTAASGSYSVQVVQGELSTRTSYGGPFAVVGGVQSVAENDSLFRSGFE